jgi:hypothetical protein
VREINARSVEVLKIRHFVIGSVSLDRAVRETFAPPVFATESRPAAGSARGLVIRFRI